MTPDLTNISLSHAIATFNAEQVTLRVATQGDVANVVALLDRCYRSDVGWTNEAHLIGGIRTTPAEIARMIDDPQIYLFVFENPEQLGQILGCICVTLPPKDNVDKENAPANNTDAYIGTFAVVPELQGKGVGNVMLNAVETFATRHAASRGLTHFSMSVLNHRPELLAYYQRRGYRMTGESEPFPIDGNNGVPKREDILLQSLQKPISTC